MLCFLNACKFLIMYVRVVLEGGLTNLYDMVWAMHDMGVMVPFEVPSAASESAMSFPIILV